MINEEQCSGLTGLRSSGAVSVGVAERIKAVSAGGQGKTKGANKRCLGWVAEIKLHGGGVGFIPLREVGKF